MIIAREYVTFGRLVSSNDEGGKIFLEKLHKYYDKSMWDEVWNKLADKCLYQRDMSWAFKNIGGVIDEFKRLDDERPFDNGCTYEDINDSCVVGADETSVKVHLISKKYGESTIVKVVTIED